MDSASDTAAATVASILFSIVTWSLAPMYVSTLPLPTCTATLLANYRISVSYIEKYFHTSQTHVDLKVPNSN